MLDDQGNHFDSYTISLESFRSFRGPLFRKPVTGQELFFAVSYSKPALDATQLIGINMGFENIHYQFKVDWCWSWFFGEIISDRLKSQEAVKQSIEILDLSNRSFVQFLGPFLIPIEETKCHQITPFRLKPGVRTFANILIKKEFWNQSLKVIYKGVMTTKPSVYKEIVWNYIFWAR